jgi:hypothetical protein
LEQLGQALIAPNCQASRIMYTICYLERAPKELRHMFLKTETPHNSVLPSLAVAVPMEAEFSPGLPMTVTWKANA